MKLSNSPGNKNARRIRVLERLRVQLKRGVKYDILKDGDVKRIEKEIKTLEGRIVTPEVARSTRTKRYRGAGPRA